MYDLRQAPVVTQQARRILMWVMLSALAVLVSYVGFRGYFNPELLIHFSNWVHC